MEINKEIKSSIERLSRIYKFDYAHYYVDRSIEKYESEYDYLVSCAIEAAINVSMANGDRINSRIGYLDIRKFFEDFQYEIEAEYKKISGVMDAGDEVEILYGDHAGKIGQIIDRKLGSDALDIRYIVRLPDIGQETISNENLKKAS